MALPKIMHPQFDIKVPSTGKKLKFRQFLVKEEKVLLVAKTSEDDTDILTAIKQVVQNCAMDESFNVNNIAIFDLEYIFLKLRALSVTNVIKLSFKDYEDEKVYDFDVNLDEIEIEIPKDTSNRIIISDKTGIMMKYATADLYSDTEFLESKPEDMALALIVRCIDKIYDEDSVYDAKTFSREELREFIEDLDVKTFEKINDFLAATPKLMHVIKYKNSLDHDRVIELSSLNDFFMLR